MPRPLPAPRWWLALRLARPTDPPCSWCDRPAELRAATWDRHVFTGCRDHRDHLLAAVAGEVARVLR